MISVRCVTHRIDANNYQMTVKVDDQISIRELTYTFADHDYSMPYGAIMSLSDFLLRLDFPNRSHFQIFVDRLHAYNVLQFYLPKWQKNEWRDSQGQCVQHADVLQEWTRLMTDNAYVYRCSFLKK